MSLTRKHRSCAAIELLDSFEDLLWEYIAANQGELLGDARIQALTILDLDNFEILLGLAQEGHSLSALLEAKATSAFREFDFMQWLANDPAAPSATTSRPRSVEGAMQALFQNLAEAAGFDPDDFDNRPGWAATDG